MSRLCSKPKVGILAYGSLVDDPGRELLPRITGRIKSTTPFGVEYGRYSRTRAGAPTLVPHASGSPAEGQLLVLDDDVSLDEARNMLWRRERWRVGTGEAYVEVASSDAVVVREWRECPCVEVALYTDFQPYGKVSGKPNPAELAQQAIGSVKGAGDGLDGISYLRNALASGIRTDLSADYEAQVLQLTGTDSLQEALEKAKEGHHN